MPTENIMDTVNEVVTDQIDTGMDFPAEGTADVVMDQVTDSMSDMDDGSALGTVAKVAIAAGVTVVGIFAATKIGKKLFGKHYAEVPKNGPQLMVSDAENTKK